MEDPQVLSYMTDFPTTTMVFPGGTCIHSCSLSFATCNAADFGVVPFSAAAWPAANRAIYLPFDLDESANAQQVFWENGGVAGTTDVAIYDATSLKRIVALTATTNAGSIQIGNITDTLIGPGSYYLGILASTVTTQTYWSAPVVAATLRASGLVQQAVGAATLPDPMVPAVVASAYLPHVGISFQGTM